MTSTKTVTDTIVEAGNVCYRVDRIGAFTIGWDYTAYPLRSDTERLIIRFGASDGTENTWPFWNRNHAWPEAPRINGLTLVGSQFVDVDTISDCLAGEWGWTWVKAERVTPSGEIGIVPDKTRTRIAHLLGELIDDYLHRDAADTLLEAHYRHHATARADKHRQHLAWVEHELAEWHSRADHERGLLAAQLLLADPGHDIVEIPDPSWKRPSWRDSRAGLTREGMQFLGETVGYTFRRAA